MDILNYITWVKEGKIVTSLNDLDSTLIPIGLKDPRRDDDYLSVGISVQSLANIIGGGGGTGTVTSVGVTAGAGISIGGTNPITTSGTFTITNTAPDQIVTLTSGIGISVTGTYPTFTITNTSPGSTTAIDFTPITYANLVTLIGSSGLVQGDYYLITDFQTIYDQPDYDNSGYPKTVVSTLTGSIEPLIVKAVSTNELSNQALSTVYQKDVIFYDWTFQTTEVMSVAAKGRITQRTDNNNNVLPYDFRVVLFKRYESVSGSGVYNSYKDTGFASNSVIPTFGTNTYNNNIPFYKNAASPFFLPNNVFGNDCYDNTIGDLFYNNTIKNNFKNNTIGDFFYNNIISNNLHANTIATEFYNNIVNTEFVNNTIGNAFNGNTILGDSFGANLVLGSFTNNIIQSSFFVQNIIGYSFTSNNVNGLFKFNNIGDGFLLNILKNFEDNKIGNDFTSNNCDSDFIKNNIGNIFNSNTVGTAFKYNSIGNYFNTNIIGPTFVSNTIGNYFGQNNIEGLFLYNTIGDFFGMNDGSYPKTNIIGLNFESNVIGDYFWYNEIGQYFQFNNIGNYFGTDLASQNNYKNIIGNNFRYNQIGNTFVDNEIGDGFTDNYIKNYFGVDEAGLTVNGNTIDTDFTSNIIDNYFNKNTIGKGFGKNKIGFLFKNNNISDYSTTSNIFGNYCTSNIITSTSPDIFTLNNIGDYFTDNTITSDFQLNLIESNYNYKTINTPLVTKTWINGITTGFVNNTDGYLESKAYGNASQYVRADGIFASFPDISGGGGGQVYYLNGNMFQSTILGNPFYQLSTVAAFGPNADFISGTVDNVQFADFITDVGKPTQETIPAGVWIFQCYLSSTSNTSGVYATVEIYNGTTFTVWATSLVETITNGSSIDLYTFTCPVPEYTPLVPTDRVAIRFYATNLFGVDTVTLHTENSHLGSIQTTFTTGVAAIDGLSAAAQYLQVGTAGSDFNITTSGLDTHVFNLPTASALNRGALSTSDWTTFNSKQNALTFGNLTETVSSVLTITGGTGSVIGSGTTIQVNQASALQSGFLSSTDWNTFNSKQNTITLTTIGISGAATLIGSTLNIPQYSGGSTTQNVGSKVYINNNFI